MNETENITEDTQPEEADDNLEESSDVDKAVKDVIQDAQEDSEEVNEENPEDALLQRINTELGKDFKDLDTALKSWKDTTSFVGKRKEDIVKEEGEKPNGDFISRKEFETTMFYKDNPELSEHRAIIDAYAKGESISVAEAVEKDSLKAILDKAQGYDKVSKAKSVLRTNPRLASSSDKSKKAREAANKGNQEEAETLVAQSVLEAYEID